MEAPGGNGINQLWQANGRQVGKFGSLVLQIDSIEDDGTDNRQVDVLDFYFEAVLECRRFSKVWNRESRKAVTWHRSSPS